MAIPMQGRVSAGPPGAPRRGALTPYRQTAAVSIHTNIDRTKSGLEFDLLISFPGINYYNSPDFLIPIVKN